MSLTLATASLPQYETILPESQRRVEYRPFLIKEEKVLFMASETKNEDTIYKAIREVILACTGERVDIADLSIPDTEHLFLQLRASSVGETVKPNLICKKCSTPNEVEININEIKCEVPDGKPQEKQIELSKKMRVLMKYPSTKDMMFIPKDTQEIDKAFIVISKCIDRVYVGEDIYDAKEIGSAEILEFLNNLTQTQFMKLFNFIDKMPRMKKQIEYKCRKCGEENSLVLEGVSSFF